MRSQAGSQESIQKVEQCKQTNLYPNDTFTKCKKLKEELKLVNDGAVMYHLLSIVECLNEHMKCLPVRYYAVTCNSVL